MDSNNRGEGKRLPRLAASLTVRFAMDRDPAAHRAVFGVPLSGSDRQSFYMAEGFTSKTSDHKIPGISEESIASELQISNYSIKSKVEPLLSIEEDSDASEECPSLKTLGTGSEGEGTLLEQSFGIADVSPKRGKRIGGRLNVNQKGHFSLLF